MDDETIDREGVDKLLDFLTKEKFKAMGKKVKSFAEENPNASLNEAEKFLLLLNKTAGILESLNVKRFREDFEAAERDICVPLYAVKVFIEGMKTNKEFQQVLAMTLEVVNFMKGQNFTGFQMEDIAKLDSVKDKTNSHSLTYHIVRKVLEANPSFAGFPENMKDNLARVAKLDLKVLEIGLEQMEKECRYVS